MEEGFRVLLLGTDGSEGAISTETSFNWSTLFLYFSCKCPARLQANSTNESKLFSERFPLPPRCQKRFFLTKKWGIILKLLYKWSMTVMGEGVTLSAVFSLRICCFLFDGWTELLGGPDASSVWLHRNSLKFMGELTARWLALKRSASDKPDRNSSRCERPSSRLSSEVSLHSCPYSG